MKSVNTLFAFEAHLLCHPAGEDVAEVPRRNAEHYALAAFYSPGVYKIAVSGEIIDDLRQESAPVYGVG